MTGGGGTVVLLNPAVPTLLPVAALRHLGGPVHYTEELPVGLVWHLPAGRPVLIAVVLAAVGAAAAWLVTGLPAVVLVAAVAAGWSPFAWLRARGRRLRRSRRALWSDVCELLISSARAGMSLPDAVSALAANGPPPLRGAFARFAADMAASGHFDSSALRLNLRRNSASLWSRSQTRK